MTVQIPTVLSNDATSPCYQTLEAAGMDLFLSEPIALAPMERCLAPTGVRMAIPSGYEGQIRPRSGLAARLGLSMVNSPGTIDSDYRGEIKIILINLGKDVVKLAKGERVAQMVICPVVRAELRVTDSLEKTDRGEGGFGSTGV
jgi:dUTP pyrophosphatase